MHEARERPSERYSLRRGAGVHYDKDGVKRGVNVVIMEVTERLGKRGLRKIGIRRSDVKCLFKYEIGLRISVKAGMKKYPEAAKEAVLKELTQLVEMGTFTPQKQSELTDVLFC